MHRAAVWLGRYIVGRRLRLYSHCCEVSGCMVHLYVALPLQSVGLAALTADPNHTCLAVRCASGPQKNACSAAQRSTVEKEWT
jgi:hypothetical protein